MSALQIVEHASASYGPRTRHNAKSADLTVAFALNFSTAGERLTHKEAGERYVAIPLDQDPLEAARVLYRALRAFNARALNVAGNGIYTLAPRGWPQARLNAHVFAIVSKVHEHWPLTRIISGGQTGADLAGIVAAHALGVDAIATLPRGFIQRREDGVDRPVKMEVIREEVIRAAASLRQDAELRASNQPSANHSSPSP